MGVYYFGTWRLWYIRRLLRYIIFDRTTSVHLTVLFRYIVLDHFGTYQTCNLSMRNLIELITVPGGFKGLISCNLFVMDPKINSTWLKINVWIEDIMYPQLVDYTICEWSTVAIIKSAASECDDPDPWNGVANETDSDKFGSTHN